MNSRGDKTCQKIFVSAEPVMNGFQVMLMFAQSARKCFKYFPVQNVKVILLKMQQYVLLVEKNTFSIYGLIVLIGYYQSHFLLLYPHLF